MTHDDLTPSEKRAVDAVVRDRFGSGKPEDIEYRRIGAVRPILRFDLYYKHYDYATGELILRIGSMWRRHPNGRVQRVYPEDLE